MGKKSCAVIILVLCLALFGCAAQTSESSSVVSSNDSSLSSSQGTSSPSSGTVSSDVPSSSSAGDSLSSISETHKMSIDDYIETAYSVNIKTFDGDTYSYNVPNIKGIDSPYVSEVNAKLNKMIEEFKEYEEYYKNNNSDVHYGGQTFQRENLIYLNNDVLSLVLHGTVPGGLRWYDVYNINVITGKEVTNVDILDSKNISEQEYIEKLKETSKEYFLKHDPYDNIMACNYSQEEYNKFVDETVSPEFCNIKNALFLGEDGNLNAVIKYSSVAGPPFNYDIAVIAVAGK